MLNIKPLLVYLQAADYPEVLQELDKIPCDKLILKYIPYPHPHNIARDFFLQHEEYTHLIIQPQDLVVTKKNYGDMVKTLQKHNFPVLSAVCNVGRNGPLARCWAICLELPHWNINYRKYKWLPMGKNLKILQVKFQGHIFDFIRRDIVGKHLIDGTPIFRGAIHTDGHPAPDLTFCHGCNKLQIPIHANTEIETKHLATHENIQVGKKDIELIYIKNNKPSKIGIPTLI